MTKILIDRSTVEIALGALESHTQGKAYIPLHSQCAIAALKNALAEQAKPTDPVTYDGWVLREVLFDNGEPIGHRAPEQEPVALPDWFNHAFPGGKLEAVGFHMPTPRAYAEEMYKRWKSRIRELKAELAGLTDAQRKPLTEEDIVEILCKHFECVDDEYIKRAAQEIAAHNIKENT